MLSGQNLHQNEALSMYFEMISTLLVTPIQIWSNPALKLTIIMKEVNVGKFQSPLSPQ